MKEFVESEIFTYIVTPVIYIGLAYIFYNLLTLFLSKALNPQHIKNKNKKRVNTTLSLINNCLKYIVVFLTILVILNSYGIDVNSILAGVGIVAAVLTLAFQDLAKDFIAGISIVMEDQFEIGDDVSINGFRGNVIKMGLKTTRLRDYTGAVQIISNHLITEVTNYSLNPSLAEVEVVVDKDNDLDKVESIINKTIANIDNTYENLKGKTELWGVELLDQNTVTYKIAVKVKTGQNSSIQRKIRRDIQAALTKGKIKMPQTHLEVNNGK